MTLAVQTTRQLYNGNGVTTSFAIPFAFSANAEVKVVLRNDDGDETDWAYTTDYTISGTNVIANTAPASGKKLLVMMDKASSQLYDFADQSPFLPSQMEAALDAIMAILQEHDERLGRALSVYRTSSTTNPYITDAELTSLSGGAGGNQVVGEIPTGALNGTSFVMAHTPIAGTLKVYINGSRTSDFSYVGTALTTGYAPGLAGEVLIDYEY